VNGKPIPRNQNGLIEKSCIDCGKIRYSKTSLPRDRCTRCAKIYRFKHNPAVGVKNISNIDCAV